MDIVTLHKTVNARIPWPWGAFVQPLLQWKSNEYFTTCVCICSLRWPARNTHAPCCHLWPVPLYSVSPHYPIYGTVKKKKKKLFEHKRCVSSFSTTHVWNIFHSKKNWARYDKKMYICLHVKYPLFFSYFNETWIFTTDFLKKKTQISNLRWEPSSVRTDGRTERQTDVTKLIVAFRNFANASKNFRYREILRVVWPCIFLMK